jgi:predicted ATPase
MISLQSISLKPSARKIAAFPFNIPLIKTFKAIELRTEITFLVGENGSGKSTLLEALAAATALPTVGGEEVQRDQTLAQVRTLAKALKLGWQKRTHRGLFLRAEDFFNFTRRVNRLGSELKDMAEEYEQHLSGYGLALAKGSAQAQRAALVEKYGENADARSHGESFLHLFQARFVPGGLYLLDEPEAPLSPLRQLSLLSMLREMIAQNAQFIIATHSPILMAFPGAAILSCDHPPIKEVAYNDLEHVTLTRDFLNNPSAFLRHL